VLGVRFTQGDLASLPEAARQLVSYGVDLIFVDTDESAKAAQQATSQIPIVFAGIADPLGLVVVQSFARPGGNVTGVADLETQLGPKRLQVFQELIPTLKRVLFPYAAAEAYGVNMARIYAEAAQALGLELIARPLWSTEEARAFLAGIRRDEIDGIVMPFSVTFNIPGFIIETEERQGIPVLHNSVFLVESGGLASYGPDNYQTGKQAARLVDKIFKGAKPAEIPVEVNPQIEFVINLKRAAALGLTIASEVLFQADRVVR
jgi:putative ABC transport system substrate-binding protein